MGRTQWGQGNTQFVRRGFECSGGPQSGLNERPAFVLGSGVVRMNQTDEITFDLVGDQFEDVSQVFSFGG